ncbi:MAG: helix-turn-helix domain-containing protein [bacterium]|nr:helix-turn-helix domain-containing protein [bacterium]
MHRVAVLALHSVVPFDLGVPCDVFARVRLPDGAAAYSVAVCGGTKRVESVGFELRVPHDLSALEDAETIVVPGLADLDRPIPRKTVSALRAAAERGARIASICTGAFVLATAGLLSGFRATTHWRATDELAERFPAIDVDPSVLFVDNGQFLTSAGAAAGIDLCLHMVRRDHGAAVASEIARLTVAPLERDGGQAQFIARPMPASDDDSVANLLDWIESNLGKRLSIEAIARQSGMSTRSLSRKFREQTGATPASWIRQARIRRAQELLETSRLNVDGIASAVGFRSTPTFRAQFQRIVGKNPTDYRRMFRSDEDGDGERAASSSMA